MHPRGVLFGVVMVLGGVACRGDSGHRSLCPPGETACRDAAAPRCSPGEIVTCNCDRSTYRHHAPYPFPKGTSICFGDGVWSDCHCPGYEQPADTGGKAGFTSTGGRSGTGGYPGIGGALVDAAGAVADAIDGATDGAIDGAPADGLTGDTL